MRILELQPEPWEADLHGTMHVITIPSSESKEIQVQAAKSSVSDESASSLPQAYQALSYFWGPEGDEQAIKIITSNNVRKYIKIRPSLVPALKTLRSKINADDESSKFFWIDAICIDQKDDDDKSEQIPRMANIYNGAKRVVVWLGEETNTSRRAINFIGNLRQLDGFDSLLEDKKISDSWSAFFELTWKPWFNRRWIVQEIAVAREAVLLVGKDSVGWNEFADAVSLFASRTEYVRKLFNQLEKFGYNPDVVGELSESGANRLVEATNIILRKKDDGSVSEHMLSLEALVTTLPAFLASDPHDDIYAILWLSNDGVPGRKEWALRHTKTVNTPDPSPSPSRKTSPERSQGHEFKHMGPGQDKSIDEAVSVPPQNNVKPPAKTEEEHLKAGIEVPDCHTYPSICAEKDLVLPGASQSGEVCQVPPFMAQYHSQEVNVRNSAIKEQLAQVSERLSNSEERQSRARGNTLTVSPHDKSSKHGRQRTSPSPRRYPKVNYKSSIFDVYKEFIDFAIAGSKSLDIICFPWAPTYPMIEKWRTSKEKENGIEIEKEEKLPSWIQDKSGAPFGVTKRGLGQIYRRVRADPLVGRPGTGSRNYLACGKTRAHWQIDGRILKVRGQRFGQVGKVDLPALSGVIPKSWLDTVNWMDPNEQLPDKFWRTLVADRGAGGRLYPSAYWKLACKWVFEQKAIEGDLNTNDLMKHGHCNSIAKEFLHRVQAVIFNRCLITIDDDEDIIGLAPTSTREGDIIAILEGCSVPVLLRYVGKRSPAPVEVDKPRGRDAHKPQPSLSVTNEQNETESITDRPGLGDILEGNQYRFLGECYVHGMMSGEAWQFMEERKRPVEWFELV